MLLQQSSREAEVNSIINKLIYIGRPSTKEGGKPNESAVLRSARKKTMKVRDSNSFQTYIYRVLKEVKPELGVSKNAMELIN